MDEAYERRAAERRAEMVAFLAHSKSEIEAAEARIDAQLTPEERPVAIWSLVCQLSTLRGIDAAELRLDRSLARIERRRR